MARPWFTGPNVRSGRFSAGANFQCGSNVTIDVAEEVVIGDRCLLADNTYLSGRRVTIGDDFYGYNTTHLGNALDVGRGRIDEEDAILTVGDKCTFHNNRIDLTRRVTIGNDVGLSPDVVIYTHGYWQSVLEGYPAKYESVEIGHETIIGFRSVLLPGAKVGNGCVVGAQSVVAGKIGPLGIYAGSPARLLRPVNVTPSLTERKSMLQQVMEDYRRTCLYRNVEVEFWYYYPTVSVPRCELDVEAGRVVEGQEDEYSDDLRWFLFTRGIRIYTNRPFRKLGRKQ